MTTNRLLMVGKIFDRCNSFFHNIAQDITKPHRIQTCLARVVTNPPRFFLTHQHYSNLKFGSLTSIDFFKICTLGCRALSTPQPAQS